MRRTLLDLFSPANYQRASSAIARQANSALTQEQQQCVTRLEHCVDRIFECKRRDMHLRDLAHTVVKSSDADRDEPLTADAFSVYDCYQLYTQELVYFPHKFDFLILCIQSRVCLVHKPRQFHDLLDELLMPPTAALAQRIGGELLAKLIEEDEARDDEEAARVEAFVLRRDWPGQRAGVLSQQRQRQQALEAEERELEHKWRQQQARVGPRFYRVAEDDDFEGDDDGGADDSFVRSQSGSSSSARPAAYVVGAGRGAAASTRAGAPASTRTYFVQ